MRRGLHGNWNKQLRELAARGKNPPLVAAYRAMEFFDKPSVKRYALLEKAAVKAGVWEAIRNPILAYLETGRRPHVAPIAPTQRKGKPARNISPPESTMPAWPLPAIELPIRNKDAWGPCFPDAATLVDIAIKEARHDDALRWYAAGRRPGEFGTNPAGEKVAQAVQVSHPDQALVIWKELVAHATAYANPAAYQTAGEYLKKIMGVCERTKQTAAWHAYLEELRQQNSRRPRMLDVLNSLEGRRTPILR